MESRGEFPFLQSESWWELPLPSLPLFPLLHPSSLSYILDIPHSRGPDGIERQPPTKDENIRYLLSSLPFSYVQAFGFALDFDLGTSDFK